MAGGSCRSIRESLGHGLVFFSWKTIQILLVMCFLPGYLCKDEIITTLDKWFAGSSYHN